MLYGTLTLPILNVIPLNFPLEIWASQNHQIAMQLLPGYKLQKRRQGKRWNALSNLNNCCIRPVFSSRSRGSRNSRKDWSNLWNCQFSKEILSNFKVFLQNFKNLFGCSAKIFNFWWKLFTILWRISWLEFFHNAQSIFCIRYKIFLHHSSSSFRI